MNIIISPYTTLKTSECIMGFLKNQTDHLLESQNATGVEILVNVTP